MKKFVLLLTAIVLIGLILSACRTHERCPAYGKIDKKKVEKSV
ncbi:MAG: hypothetical protein ABII90_09560 [Bacteroidota bacterium]